MSILNTREKQAPMPRAANVTPLPGHNNPPTPPAPPPRPAQSMEHQYAEEALRAAQHAIDQVRTIDRLSQEVADWQRKALLAEAEIKRLEKKEMDLTQQLENLRNELTEDRDSYRDRVNTLVTQFGVAGEIILRAMEAAKGATMPHVDMSRFADQIEREQRTQVESDDAPIPAVVRAGPRDLDDTK